MDCFSDDEDEEEKEEEEIKPKKKKIQKKKKKNREELYDIDDEYNEAESNNNKNVINKFCVDALSNDRTFCVNDNNEIVVYRFPPNFNGHANMALELGINYCPMCGRRIWNDDEDEEEY